MRSTASGPHKAVAAALVAAVLVLWGCSPAGSTSQPSGASGSGSGAAGETKTLKVGAAISLTGPLSVQGGLVKRGYDMWMAAVNDAGGFKVGSDTYKVELVYYDDEGVPATAASLAEKLITEDHVDFIFGPFGSDLNFAVSPITERYGKILIDSSGNADRILQQGHKNVFMLIPPASKFINPFVETLNGLTDPPATLALVSTNSLFGQLQREGFKAHLAEVGKPSLVLDETYAADAKDFTAVISKVVAAKPDVVVNIANIELGTYLTQLRQSGFQPKAWFGSGPPLVDMYKLIKDDALYLFGNSSSWDASVKWCDDIMGCTADIISRHEKMFGDKNVSYFSVNAAGAGVVLVKAIQAAGSIDPVAVSAAIRKLDVELSLGPVKFDDTGSNTAAYPIIQQIKEGGKIDVVYPADRQTGTPVYPMPNW